LPARRWRARRARLRLAAKRICQIWTRSLRHPTSKEMIAPQPVRIRRGRDRREKETFGGGTEFAHILQHEEANGQPV
jgi:hypothetical protein